MTYIPNSLFNNLGNIVSNATGAPDTGTGQKTVVAIVKGSTQDITNSIVVDVFGESLLISDSIQSALVVNSGSTVSQSNAYGAYLRLSHAYESEGTTQIGVAYSGVVESTLDNSAAWGDKTTLMDNGPGNGSGRFLIGSERNFNITKSNTTALGYVVSGSSTESPNEDSACFVADSANTSNANIYWPVSFKSVDNASTRALEIGVSRNIATASSNSQLLVFRATDKNSELVESYIYGNETGITIEGKGTRDIAISNGKLLTNTGVRIGNPSIQSTPLLDFSNSGLCSFDARISSSGGTNTEGMGSLDLTASALTLSSALLVFGSEKNKATLSADKGGSLTLETVSAYLTGDLVIGSSKKKTTFSVNSTGDLTISSPVTNFSNSITIGSGSSSADLSTDSSGNFVITAASLQTPSVVIGSSAKASITSDSIGNLILSGASVVTSGGNRVWDSKNLSFGSGIDVQTNSQTNSVTLSLNTGEFRKTTFSRSAYNESGIINPEDTLVVLSGANALVMTLENGTTDGHPMLIKHLGTTDAVVILNLDGNNLSITLKANIVPIKDKLKIKWSDADSTWFAE